jgi:hypothetical protein
MDQTHIYTRNSMGLNSTSRIPLGGKVLFHPSIIPSLLFYNSFDSTFTFPPIGQT